MVSGSNVFYYFNTASYNLGSVDLLRHKLYVDPTKHVILYDNTQKQLSETTFNTQLNYGLFGRIATNGSLQYSFRAKVYECKLFISGELVRWFIPCKNNLNVCGLYDIHTGTFYSSDDTNFLQPGSNDIVNNLQSCYIRGKSVCRILCNDNVVWGLPKEYTKIPYITNPSTAYINTKVSANSNLRLDLTFSINNLQSSTQTYPIFGGRQSTTTNVFGGWYSSGVSTMYGHYGSRGYNEGHGNIKILDGLESNTIYKYSMNKNNLSVDEYNTVMTSYTFTTDIPIYLFAINTNGNIDNRRLLGNVYMCQIWDNDILVRNYVPCKDSNNVCGLYDLCNDDFYASNSSVNFVYNEN